MSSKKRSAARRRRDAAILKKRRARELRIKREKQRRQAAKRAEYQRKRKARELRIKREKQAAAKRKAKKKAKYEKLRKIRALRKKKEDRRAEREKLKLKKASDDDDLKDTEDEDLDNEVDVDSDEATTTSSSKKEKSWSQLSTAEKRRQNALNKAEDPIASGNPSGKSFSWKKIRKNVEDKWASRLTSEFIKPKRLNIDFKPTGRLKKYGDGKGGFDRKSYIGDFREGLAESAEKRGFRGDVRKALNETTAQKIQETKPKYGSVIKDLKKKLGGDLNHKELFADTTKKLTQKVKSGAKGYQKTGLDIIKNRSSEDGAVPRKYEGPPRKRKPRQRPSTKPNKNKKPRQ